VLSGHDHLYERGWGDGFAYVVSGGGGAPVYKVREVVPESRKVEPVRHFVEVGVSPTAMQLVATRVDGSTIERCALVKGRGWDCDEKPEVAGPRVSPPPPSQKARCACEAVGAAGESGGGAFVGGAVTFFTRRRRRSASTSERRAG